LVLVVVASLVPRAGARASAQATFTHLFDLPSICSAITLTARHDVLGRPYLYVAATAGGLEIYDVAGTPILVGAIGASALGGLNVMSLAQSDDRLYLALGNFFGTARQAPGLAVVDVSNPAQAKLLGLWRDDSLGGGAGAVAAVGNTVYLGAMANGLVILDVSNPASITELSRFVPDINFPDSSPDPAKINARGLAVRGNLVYLCDDAGGFRIIDVTHPGNPVEVGRYANPAMEGKPRAYNNVVLNGDLAYVAVDYLGMEILDVSDPASIQPVGWWNPWDPSVNPLTWFTSDGHANELAFDPAIDTVFLAAGRSDLVAVSVADPAHPVEVGSYGEVGDQQGTWGVSRYGDKLYLGYLCTLGIPFAANWAGVRAVSYRSQGLAVPCVADAHTLCLDDQAGDERYRVTVEYHTTEGGGDGQPHPGNAIPLSSLGVTHGGLVWFFDKKNPEMLIKVLDGTNSNQHRWVFYSAGTNVGLKVSVEDTQTGATVPYANSDRHPAAPVLDTAAFTADGEAGAAYQLKDESFDFARDFHQETGGASSCATSDTSLCIGGRFEVTASYHTTLGGHDGENHAGRAIPLSALGVARGGLFWFFNRSNPEMLIKVLDACPSTGYYWVFYSAGTSVGLTTRVEDTQTHRVNVYTNPDQSQAPPLLDQEAFPCQ